MTTAYGYSRVSGRNQAQDGTSMEVQAGRLRSYYDFRLASTHQWGEVVTDPAESAKLKRLFDRPGGRRLAGLLCEGDAVIVTALDRAFRSVEDCLSAERWLRERGVALHIIGLSIDTGAPMGRLVFTMMGAFAEFERDMIRSRVLSGAKHLKDQGYYVFGDKKPYGYKVVKDGKRRRLEPWPDDPRRAEGAYLLEVGEKIGGKAHAVYWWLLRNRTTNPATGRAWTRSQVKIRMEQETKYRTKHTTRSTE